MALNAQQRQLVVDNKDLIDILANKHRHLLPEKDDIIGALEEALCLAADNYNGAQGATFRTYASRYMEGFLKNFYRDIMPHTFDSTGQAVFVTEVSMDSLGTKTDEWGNEDLGLEAVTPSEPVIDTEGRETAAYRFRELMKGLTKKERKLILSKYGFDGQMTAKEHALKQGVSQMAISLQMDKIENKLKRKAAEIKKVA